MRTAIALALCIASAAHATPKKKAKKHAPAATASAASDEPPDPNAKSRFTMPRDATASAAYRYGTMSRASCEAELRARAIRFTREPSTRGVLAPVRIAGALHGVTFHTDLRPTERATSPWEIADCRLVLALDDFAAILARHDIVEVVHYSMYRKPTKLADGELGKRHEGALALDAARFVARDGSKLDVLHDFHGAIGAKTCGDEASPAPATPEATQLRALLCEVVDARIFNVVLTPNYNQPHANHFHLEVTSGVKWFLVH